MLRFIFGPTAYELIPEVFDRLSRMTLMVNQRNVNRVCECMIRNRDKRLGEKTILSIICIRGYDWAGSV